MVTRWHTRIKCTVLRTKYVNIKSTTVYVPASEMGLSQPLSRQRVCPSPQSRGEGGTLGEGLGKSQFRRLEKRLSTLPALWYCVSVPLWGALLNRRFVCQLLWQLPLTVSQEGGDVFIQLKSDWPYSMRPSDI